MKNANTVIALQQQLINALTQQQQQPSSPVEVHHQMNTLKQQVAMLVQQVTFMLGEMASMQHKIASLKNLYGVDPTAVAAAAADVAAAAADVAAPAAAAADVAADVIGGENDATSSWADDVEAEENEALVSEEAEENEALVSEEAAAPPTCTTPTCSSGSVMALFGATEGVKKPVKEKKKKKLVAKKNKDEAVAERVHQPVTNLNWKLVPPALKEKEESRGEGERRDWPGFCRAYDFGFGTCTKSNCTFLHCFDPKYVEERLRHFNQMCRNGRDCDFVGCKFAHSPGEIDSKTQLSDFMPTLTVSKNKSGKTATPPSSNNPFAALASD